MDIYDHPTFRMACRQFESAADYLEIPECDRARLTAFTQALQLSRRRRISMRLAALSLGIQRVHDAKRRRGLFP